MRLILWLFCKLKQSGGRRVRLWLGSAAAVFALSGCVTLVHWDWTVARFHNLGDVMGKTFTVVPAQSANNDSLEFIQYAGMLAAKLEGLGMKFRPPIELGKIDFVVCLDYGIGEPRQFLYNSPIYGQTSPAQLTYVNHYVVNTNGQGSNITSTVNTPATYGVVGSTSQSVTNYHQYIRIFIYDGKPAADKTWLKRYEGKADGDGYLRDLTKIVPSGIKALLTEFPGESGGSKKKILFGTDQIP